MTTFIPNTTGIQLLTWSAYEGKADFGYPLPIMAWRITSDDGEHAVPVSCDPLRGERYALLLPSGEVILPDSMKFPNVADFEEWMREEEKDRAAVEAAEAAENAA